MRTLIVVALTALLTGCSTNFRDPFLSYEGDYMNGYYAPQNQNPASGNFYFPNLRLW